MFKPINILFSQVRGTGILKFVEVETDNGNSTRIGEWSVKGVYHNLRITSLPFINHQWMIDRRIACPEAGYPEGEARFLDIMEYIKYLENKEIDENPDSIMGR